MSDKQIMAALRELAVAFTNNGDAILAIADDELKAITIAQCRKLFNVAQSKCT